MPEGKRDGRWFDAIRKKKKNPGTEHEHGRRPMKTKTQDSRPALDGQRGYGETVALPERRTLQGLAGVAHC